MTRQALIGLSILLIALSSSAETVHVVAPGETLSTIAARYLGAAGAAARIAAFNNIANPNRISIGQRIWIPDATSAPRSAQPDRDSAVAVPSRNAPEPSPGAEGQRLIAIEVTGPLEAIRDGALVPIGEMSAIRPGDSLRTSPTGRALLSGMNGERYLLGPDVSILIRELSASYADRRCVLRLDKGRLHLQAPETPFLTRYLIETPSGSISARHGEMIVEVIPPALARVSILEGRAVGAVPMGSIEIPAQTGLVLRTTEPPPLPRPLPSLPGVSIAASKRSIIVAAAGAADHSVIIDLYRDEALQKHVTQRLALTDNMGLVLQRFEVPPGEYWIACQSVGMDGLIGSARVTGPLAISGD